MKKRPNQLNRMVWIALLIAIGVIGSYLVVVPVGVIRAFPIQHFLNIITVVLVGPGASVTMATGAATLRLLLGTGSVLAFPGSIVGATFVAIVDRFTKKRIWLCIAEVVGTGLVAPFLCIPVAKIFLGSELLVMGILPSFFLSSLLGSILAYVLIPVLQQRVQQR